MCPAPSAWKLPAAAINPVLSFPEYENENGPLNDASEYAIVATAVAVTVPWTAEIVTVPPGGGKGGAVYKPAELIDPTFSPATGVTLQATVVTF